MNTRISVLLKSYFARIDWKLLLFLLLFLNVKLVIKLAALIFIYILKPNIKFGIRLNSSRLPLFYCLAIIIGLINAILYQGYTNLNYSLALFTGISYWILSILAIHQLKLFVEKNDPEVIYRTLVIFFLINAAISLGDLVKIIFETGSLNPYQYQGQFQKYFISTGDYIKGLTFDTSTTNAVMSAFGVIFFLGKKNISMVFICMIILLLTGSNLVNIILILAFTFGFIFRSDRNQKSIMVVCLSLMIIFWAKVSPQNNRYMAEAFQDFGHYKVASQFALVKPKDIRHKPDSLLTIDERKEKIATLYLDSLNRIIITKEQKRFKEKGLAESEILKERPVIPGDSIHTAPFQHKDDTSIARIELWEFINHNSKVLWAKDTSLSLPGKAIAFGQTLAFFKRHPSKIFTGAGLGNFSSKLAFRTTSLRVAGGYPTRFAYISPYFLNNHLNLYLYFFGQQEKLHSVINSPNSVYDQLLSEYGIAGLIVFLFFYIGYFLKDSKKLTYGVPLILMLLGFFFIDYWFEQLSIVIIFELMVLLNKKEALALNDR
jgi:hypothetical protein